MPVIPIKETMSRSEGNRRLQRTKSAGDESRLVPEDVDPYRRVYICTHGLKNRKTRSDGSRPRQHVRLTERPLRFVVQRNHSRRNLQVKNGFFFHNHPVLKSAFKTYSTSQGVDSAVLGARVDGMLSVGAKRSRFYDYRLDHDHNVVQVHVDNITRAYASSITGGDGNEATARELAVFAVKDPENVSSVANTEGASAHMRRVYCRLRELLLVNCSHKTNSI
ncbi:hypothetical protein PHMEG_00020005 [Phytophthora megakarya]|uniref:Uncharacterized protein n=1 Tax=Phytophthora megakarya TaxID=4795 RepID=A0A225VRQ4_9STRA|nr:hypothetical protein PHMEG_00020005 [Phytophthora megakarya]